METQKQERKAFKPRYTDEEVKKIIENINVWRESGLSREKACKEEKIPFGSIVHLEERYKKLMGIHSKYEPGAVKKRKYTRRVKTPSREVALTSEKREFMHEPPSPFTLDLFNNLTTFQLKELVELVLGLKKVKISIFREEDEFELVPRKVKITGTSIRIELRE